MNVRAAVRLGGYEEGPEEDGVAVGTTEESKQQESTALGMCDTIHTCAYII